MSRLPRSGGKRLSTISVWPGLHRPALLLILVWLQLTLVEDVFGAAHDKPFTI